VVRAPDGPPRDVPNDDLRVACQFAACASRAWRQGASASAYWVNASQVSKTPASGEYVPRGAWMIHGKRNVEPDLPMDWWIGRVRLRPDGSPVPRGDPDAGRLVEKVVGGPKEGLAPFCWDLMHVVPGDVQPPDAAREVAERYGIGNEEAAAVLPAGPVRLGALEGPPR
jgi:hypothetical protein